MKMQGRSISSCIDLMNSRSVLVLNGNGVDVAKHCVPAVPTRRISITFRKMDVAKRPFGFTLELDLQGIKPLPYDLNESESASPSKSPFSVQRQPVTSEGSLERMRFPGRGSYSEIREGNSGRRGSLDELSNDSCTCEAFSLFYNRSLSSKADEDARQKLLFYGVVFLGLGACCGVCSWFCF